MKRIKPQHRPAKPARTALAQRSVLVQIEKPIYGGAFLAREQGKATFVPLTLPGEQVRARIVEDKRSYTAAEPEQIIAPAASRVVPGCPHFGECGGCHYQHASYETQLELKKSILRETLERGGVEAPENIAVLAGNPWQYRNRIRIALDGQGRVGYRSRRSHEIVPIETCPIAAPLLVRAALSAAEILRSPRGLKTVEISLFCNADETEMLASVFVRERESTALEWFAEEWRERIEALAGVELVLEGGQNAMPRTVGRWGAPSIMYRAGGVAYRVDHGAFFQVNRWLVEGLLKLVTAGRSGTLAWDLFAGVGLFARRLAESFEQVVAIEASPAATQALAWNLKDTASRSISTDTLAFLKSRAKAPKSDLIVPDLIVIDPPRTGLGLDTGALVTGVAAPRIVYVSCDPATLTRDLRVLAGAGYSIGFVTLADLFPQTFHLETVVELHRS
jgi:23S rRNA (uracil1939-C5)-methyltransferase